MYIFRSQLTDADNAVPVKLRLRKPGAEKAQQFNQVITLAKVQENVPYPIIRTVTGFVVEEEKVKLIESGEYESALFFSDIDVMDYVPCGVGN